MNSVLSETITEHQLAEEVGRNVRTLQIWRAQRVGPPFIRLGRQILYRRKAVREWIESLEQEQPRAGAGRPA